MKKSCFLVLLIAFQAESIAASVGLGAGVFSLNPGSFQRDGKDGGSSFYVHPYLQINLYHKVRGNHFFSPEVGWIKHRSEDEVYGEHSKNTLFILWDLAYFFTDRFILKYGIGTFYTKISGEGGEVTVRNGNSYATAYRPNYSVTSYNSTLNLGFQYLIMQNTGIKLETYSWEWLSSERRTYSYSLAGTYYF